jgi:acyl-CoA reductase-like NAD-dependent aldehyde dehydrogenase
LTNLLIGGRWVEGNSTDTLFDKFWQKPYGEMMIATPAQVDDAIAGVSSAAGSIYLPPYERYRILLRAASLVEARKTRFIELMRDEAGFTHADGDNEVARCVQTLELSAEQAKLLSGELIPMSAARGGSDRLGFTIREPLGVICAITPFNSPLNTVAHKVGPALAGGNAVIIKPAELTPLSAVELCRVLIEAGVPPGLLALVHGPGERIGRQLVADPRIAFYAFTGSTRVGREIQAGAGLRRTQLELGSIASTIVCADANIDLAIPKIVNAGFRKAGQVCTSVQQLLVDRRIVRDFVPRFVAAVGALRCGDPADPAMTIGPMISIDHAQRAAAWINEAVAQGARVLTGGALKGTVLTPTVLDQVRPNMRVLCEEIFAPVVSIVEFEDLAEAIARANSTPFGLACGLFTRDISSALKTVRKLRFGGVHVNEASSARVDVMPFGGVKDSGYGHEGPAYAIREMTEERLITVSY